MRRRGIVVCSFVAGLLISLADRTCALPGDEDAVIRSTLGAHEKARIEAAERIANERQRRADELERQLAEIRKWTSAQFELGERGVIDKPQIMTEYLVRWQRGRELNIYKLLQFPEKSRGEIESGDALNSLLDRIGPAAAQNLTTRRLNPKFAPPLHASTTGDILDEPTFNRLMIANDITGAKDVRRGDSGPIDVDWPSVLLEHRWADHRRAVEQAGSRVMAELSSPEGLSPEAFEQLRKAVGAFNAGFEAFRAALIRGPHADDFGFQLARLIDGSNHLRRLVSSTYYIASARKIYELPVRPKYVAGNIEEFLHYMAINNLRFDRAARAIDRPAYHRVFDMMVRYYLDQTAVTRLEKQIEQQLAEERYLTREALDVALGKTLSEFDAAAVSIAELNYLTELVD